MRGWPFVAVSLLFNVALALQHYAFSDVLTLFASKCEPGIQGMGCTCVSWHMGWLHWWIQVSEPSDLESQTQLDYTNTGGGGGGKIHHMTCGILFILYLDNTTTSLRHFGWGRPDCIPWLEQGRAMYKVSAVSGQVHFSQVWLKWHRQLPLWSKSKTLALKGGLTQ